MATTLVACGVVAIAAAAAVAVAITVTSLPGSHAGFQRIATLTGAGNASGYVDVGRADGAVEPVVVSISHLDPSPGDQYYEIWFQTGGKDVPGVAFNAGSDGRAEVHLSAPTNTKWVRCWITRQSISDPSSSHHRHARQLAGRRHDARPACWCMRSASRP